MDTCLRMSIFLMKMLAILLTSLPIPGVCSILHKLRHRQAESVDVHCFSYGQNPSHLPKKLLHGADLRNHKLVISYLKFLL